MRPELLEKKRERQDLRLNVFVQRIKFGLELIPDLNLPSHILSMTCKPYVLQYIQNIPGCHSRSALELWQREAELTMQ